MSASSLEKLLVRINIHTPNSKTVQYGSGVLIKPNAQARFAYLLTSKTLFSAFTQASDIALSSDTATIQLTHQTTEQPIKLQFDRFYSLEQGLAIALIDLTQHDFLRHLNMLEIMDSLSLAAQHKANTFQLACFAKHDPTQTQLVALHNSLENRAALAQEEFISFTDLQRLEGIQGAPIAVTCSDGCSYLKSIALQAISCSELQALKLSNILTSINQTIKTIHADLPIIQLAGFSTEQAPTLSHAKLSTETLDNATLNQSLRLMEQAENELRKQNSALSLQYLQLAALAEHNDLASLKSSALNKALEWDKDVLASLNFSKARENNNKAEINNYNPILLSEKIKKYDALIKLEKNPKQQAKFIKEALQQITNAKLYENDLSNSLQQTQKIDDYALKLNALYEANIEYRDIYKYKHLADFYFTLPNQSQNSKQQAAYYYQLTQALLEKSPMSQLNEALAKEVAEQLEALRQRQVDVITEKEQAYERAKAIILSQEDKDIRELLLALAEESKEIKKSDLQQENIQLLLIGVLSSLNQNLDQQNTLVTKNHTNIENTVNQVKHKLLELESLNKNQLISVQDGLKQKFDESYQELLTKITQSSFNEQQKKDLSTVLLDANTAFLSNLEHLKQNNATTSETLENLYSLNREHRNLLANIHSTLNDSNEIAQLNQSNSLNYYEKFGSILLEQQNSILSALNIQPIQLAAKPAKKSPWTKLLIVSGLIVLVLLGVLYFPMDKITEQTSNFVQSLR